MIGVHTPELESEKVLQNVEAAIRREGVKYPVLVDGDFANWNRWKQQYWPTVYVVDRSGQVTFKWEGELGYQGANGEAQLAEAIEKALR